MSASLKVGAVILAAGYARRFGADKRLQPLGTSTVAETTINKYSAAFDHVRVVVKDHEDPLLQRLDKNVEVVHSPDAQLGMGHSLAAGFTELGWDYAFVALADMPLVELDTLHKLKIHAVKDVQVIIRPAFKKTDNQDQTFGHPIGFPKRLFSEVAQCRGDHGARELLERYAGLVDIRVFADPGVYLDIDTPEALARIQHGLAKGR